LRGDDAPRLVALDLEPGLFSAITRAGRGNDKAIEEGHKGGPTCGTRQWDRVFANDVPVALFSNHRGNEFRPQMVYLLGVAAISEELNKARE